LPYNDYFEYYGPDYRLDVLANNMENHNTRDYLNKIKYAPLHELTLVGQRLSRTCAGCRLLRPCRCTTFLGTIRGTRICSKNIKSSFKTKSTPTFASLARCLTVY
jgi:hypothetical protein